MKFYLSTKNIPQLRDKPLTERLTLLKQAESKLSVPEKFMLNIGKLLIIVPVFVFILRASENWYALLYAGLFILAYPFILKPLQYSICAKYLAN